MPIQKTKVLPSGVSGNYWKITEYSIKPNTSQVTYHLSLFKDSNSGEIPIVKNVKKYIFNLSSEQIIQEDLYVLGYELILEKAETMVHSLFGISSELVKFDLDLSGGSLV